MCAFKRDSLEIRVIETVRDNYPITKGELRKVLKVSKVKLDLALKRLERMGYVEYDVLPDKVYVRLKVVPVGAKARRSKKKAERKRARSKGRTLPGPDDYSYI
jgi:DNA-binding MarR family transcriptional regulator